MNGKKLHYAWMICAITCLIYICTIGILSNSSFGPYLIENGGLTNTQNSLLVSLRSFTSIIFCILCAPFYKKVSLRAGLFGGVIAGGVAWLCYAIASSYALYVVGALIMGAVHGIAANVATAMIINNWFTTRKNLAFGITTASSGLTGVILPPVVRTLVEQFSLRTCFIAVAVFFFTVGILTWLIVRDHPEDLGMHTYGYDQAETENKKKTSAHKAVYTPSRFHFILLLVVYFFIGGQLYATWSHVSVLLSTAGFESATFAGLLSFCGLMLMLGKILYGWITDRGNAEISFYIFCPLQAVGLLLNAYAASTMNFPIAIAGCLLEGGAGVISTVGLSSMAAALYPDEKNFNRIVVWFTTFYNIGHTVFTPMFGIIADRFGSYSPAYYGCAVLGFLNIILVAVAFRGAAKRAKVSGLLPPASPEPERS